MPSRRILLIDGMNLFIRGFTANPATSTAGNYVGGVVGSLSTIQHVVDMFRPDRVYVAWEGGGSPRRRSIYPEYKANRRPQKLNRFYESTEIPNTTQNRDYQVRLLVEILKNTPVCQIYVSDCEADDVIGYLAKNTLREDDVTIMSSDKDYYQLLTRNNIRIYTLGSKKIIDRNVVEKEYGSLPENFALMKSICGDDSDNINGVPGFGFKTASKRIPLLLEKVDASIDDVIALAKENATDSNGPKAYKALVENEDIIRRNWKLVHLDVSNIAASQVKKVNDIVENYQPARNKMQCIRILLREGIQTYDIDRFFASLNHVGVL
jgi:DNA polymerase-1